MDDVRQNEREGKKETAEPLVGWEEEEGKGLLVPTAKAERRCRVKIQAVAGFAGQVSTAPGGVANVRVAELAVVAVVLPASAGTVRKGGVAQAFPRVAAGRGLLLET